MHTDGCIGVSVILSRVIAFIVDCLPELENSMKVSRSAILPYSTEKMYDVVADIRSYPGFLNWCDNMDIISETSEEVIAKLMISYGKLKFSFTTKNKVKKNESIEMSLVDGPFSSLSGVWTIKKLNEDACKVSLEMDFVFDNPITHKLFGRVFQKVISAQLDAFQNRAKQLYGT